MDITDGQIGLYFRRRAIGLRLLSHGSRPKSVQQWCALTRDQLLTLRRRWSLGGKEARRGQSLSSFKSFFSSARVAGQAALFVSLCHMMGLIPAKRGKEAVKALPSLQNALRLCEALEMLKEWDPQADLDFERAELLLTGVVDGQEVDLGRCAKCHADMLIDRLDVEQTSCTYCR